LKLKNHKWIVAIIIMALLFTLGIGCQPEKKLYIFNWGRYIDPYVIELFENEYKIKVIYREYSTNEEMYTKLKSEIADFDIIFPSDYMAEKMIKESMLEKIDYYNISNYKYIDEEFRGLPYDYSEQYTLPYFWGTMEIIYNKDYVGEEIVSWDALWDDKYRKQIGMLDSPRDSIAVALIKL